MTTWLLRAIVAAACLMLGPVAAAQEQLLDLSAQSARVSRAARGNRLEPARADRLQTVAEFLRQRHDETTIRNLVVERRHEAAGRVHLTLRQQVAGLEVYGTYVRASFAPNGDLISVVENLVPAARALRPALIGPEAALSAVMTRFYPGAPEPPERATVAGVTTFEAVGPLSDPPTVTRVALPLRGAVLDSGYLVQTWDVDNVLRRSVVSSRGEILHVELRTSPDSYRIFPVSPAAGGQVVVQGPEEWLGSSTTTSGNNVDAYLDRDNDNGPDAGGRPISPTQDFTFAWDGTASPTTTTNQMAGVTNLFYLNNVLHDRLHAYGFTESAGNFQVDNFGRGGQGGDPVRAEAQDGGGVNNANFATPPDGQSPRMQMYLWTTAAPERDGDLDSDIVYHEYGHGLTWRMIGDMSGAAAGAVGEGMSDTLATYFNDDDRVAEYSANNAIGIRSAPYTGYTRTYGLVVGILGPHLDGEIYAATLWRLRQLWIGQGWPTDTLLRHIVDGMNYTTPRPAFEDMRDGILSSIDQLETGIDPDEASCTVWTAFAQFGIGEGADGGEICAPILGCFFQATESFAVPEACGSTPPPQNAPPTVTITSPADQQVVTAGTAVTFAASAADAEDGDLAAGLIWTSDLDGTIGTGGSFTTSTLSEGTHFVTAVVSDSGGLIGTAAVTLTVQPPQPPPPVTLTLSAGTRKVKGSRFADLAWTGGPGGTTAVYRDDAIIAPAVTGSEYTDTLPKKGRSFTYHVCQAGICSNQVVVTF